MKKGINQQHKIFLSGHFRSIKTGQSIAGLSKSFKKVGLGCGYGQPASTLSPKVKKIQYKSMYIGLTKKASIRNTKSCPKATSGHFRSIKPGQSIAELSKLFKKVGLGCGHGQPWRRRRKIIAENYRRDLTIFFYKNAKMAI